MPTEIPADAVRTWRMPLALRLGIALLLIAMWSGNIFITVAIASQIHWKAFVWLPFMLFFFGFPALVARYIWGAYLKAGPDGVTLGRGRRKVTVPWPVIDTCQAGRGGLTIRCTDGRTLFATVPQKAPYATLLHLTTRADRACTYLEQRAQQSRAKDGSG